MEKAAPIYGRFKDSVFDWRSQVIYQIYPRSFQDASNDGMGDLRGITSRLSYLAKLNIDTIWISPFFKSPMADFGYDISDYRAVDPTFGSLSDFEELLKTAHELGLKVVIDQVYSHTSDQHAWFEESRQDRTNPKADWYVWADPQPDGSPPNNWLSLFGGCAWTWDSRREQYYLHNFLESQPDLNFHNPEVRQAQLDNARFWLDLGVDGFRLDVVNFYYHRQDLANNPPVPSGAERTLAVSNDNPYSLQRHVNDICQPENIRFLQDLRRVMDAYPGTFTIGEISCDEPLKIMAEYTSNNDKLNMAYTFDLLSDNCSAPYFRDVIRKVEAQIGDGWPCWAISNHDVQRYVTRWGNEADSNAFAKVAVAMMLSLRGTPCLYQGDELGLPQADVPYERIQDPYGLPFWPKYKGRDGCRTPMPWSRDTNCGFSRAEPWLPIDQRHEPLCAVIQDNDNHSSLVAIRELLAWRQSHPELLVGEIELIEDSGELLCFTRSYNGSTLFCAFNMTGDIHEYTLPYSNLTPYVDLPFSHSLVDQILRLEPFHAFYGKVT